MRTAAAQVTVERGLDLRAGWIGISLQQRCGAHQDSGQAIAALQRLLGDKGALKRMRVLLAAKAFDGGDVFISDGPQRRVAGVNRVVVDDDGAGAAFASAAAEMRTC